MKLKNLALSMFIGASALSLVGCGDKVKLSIDEKAASYLSDRGYNFQQAEVFQLSEEQAKSLFEFTNKTIPLINKHVNGNVSDEEVEAINSEKIRKLFVESKARANELEGIANSNWDSQVVIYRSNLESAIAPLNTEKEKALHNYGVFMKYISMQVKQRDELDAEVKRIEESKTALHKQYDEGISKDIVDLQLPIRVQDSYQMRWSTIKAKSEEQCPEYKGYGHFYFSGNCYYLRPVAEALLNSPSYEASVGYLSKVVEANARLSDIKGQKFKLNGEIDKQSIIAENQVGISFNRLNSQIRSINNQIDNQEQLFKRLTTDEQKMNFIQLQLTGFKRDSSRVLYDAVHAEIASKIDTNGTSRTTTMKDGVAVNTDLSRSAVVYTFKDNRGELLSSIIPFEAKMVAESKSPIVLKYGDLFYNGEAGKVSSNSRKLHSALLKG